MKKKTLKEKKNINSILMRLMYVSLRQKDKIKH
jgi:hypothetical protein